MDSSSDAVKVSTINMLASVENGRDRERGDRGDSYSGGGWARVGPFCRPSACGAV